MLAGEPDRFAALDDENIFLKGGGLGAGSYEVGKFISGGTDSAKGALGATRYFGKADEGAEFHEGLIMETWIFVRNDGGGKGLEVFVRGGSAVAGEESAEDAGDVAIESRGGDSEGDAGDGASGVVTDSWKETEFLGIGRELALGKVLDSFC